MTLRILLFSVCAALLGSTACDNEVVDNEPTEDQEYFCDQYARYYCPAFLTCREDLFYRSFHDYTECVDLTERDCLEPPPGFESCTGVTREEADSCTDYIQMSLEEDCTNLFGLGADMSPCEEICD